MYFLTVERIETCMHGVICIIPMREMPHWKKAIRNAKTYYSKHYTVLSYIISPRVHFLLNEEHSACSNITLMCTAALCKYASNYESKVTFSNRTNRSSCKELIVLEQTKRTKMFSSFNAASSSGGRLS